jgi:hypothetical protein
MGRLAAVVAGLVVVLAGALHWWEPFLTEQRAVITSSPSPGPRSASVGIAVKPRSEICVAPVALDRATARGLVALSSSHAGPSLLEFDASAPGYRSNGRLRPTLQRTPIGLAVPLGRPTHDVIGKVCIRNASRSRLSFVGTNDPIAIGLARTTIDGKEPAGQAIELELLEARNQSVLGRLGAIVHHAADFTGNLMPFWFAWLLLVALVVGTPFAIFGAYWTTLRSE